MAISTLDLFVLTFNCGKSLINAAVFGSHLGAALSQNATGLPDLVVFSLQEVAPLSYSFIGSYFLQPYYARFEEALNLGAIKALSAQAATPSSGDDAGFSAQTAGSAGEGRASYPYTLVRARNVGMTAIMLFARDPAAVHHIEEAETGFGAAEMGNKGAVGLRVTWTSRERSADGRDGVDGDGTRGESTELTFVATHLAAMEWNLKKRNANWKSIVSGLTFRNPKTALPGVFPEQMPAPEPAPASQTGSEVDSGSQARRYREPSPASASSSEGSEEEEDDAAPLLSREGTGLSRRSGDSSRSRRRRRGGPAVHPEFPELDHTHHAALHELSVFRPTAHLFVAGDLNYRIGSTTPAPGSDFPSFDPASPNHWPAFLARDQLNRERAAGRTLTGLSEADIKFGPSYKYDVISDDDAANAENAEAVAAAAAHGGDVVPWRWAPHRWPSWCDRVLFLEVPGWARRRVNGAEPRIAVAAYDLLPLLRSSDHRAVFLRASVPLLDTDTMRPPATAQDEEKEMDEELEDELALLDDADLDDPRVRLPVPIDVHAWQRRAAARRREIMVGWSVFLWSTREGAVLIATALVLTIGGWWVWSLG